MDKSNREKNIPNTYTELYRYEQTGNFERALKAANRILHMAPEESTALHCKAVCYIQLSKFDECLTLIKKNPLLASTLTFEKAYCQYRLNQSGEALKTIDEVDELDFRLMELKAQVLYRLENFTESFDTYQEICKVTDDEYSDERETNMSAALVYAGVNYIDKYGTKLREDTYELCFNRACQLTALGQYSEAEKKLRQCEKMCRESLEEDSIPDEEIQVELAHVKIQLGYVYQKQGRIREAHQLYVTSLKLRLEDIALTAVACNNAVVINKDQNVFDSKKKIKAATNDQLNFKLLSKQRKYIALNNALFTYYTNQYEQCKKICNMIQQTWPELTVYTKIIEILTLIKGDTYLDALNLLEECFTENEEDKLYLQLACAQLWLMQGNRQKVCQIFESMGDNRYRPGIVGALITLYLAEGKEEVAQQIYKETVEWYRVNKTAEGDLTNLYRQAAEFHIRNGQATVAANSLEELLKSNSNDKKTMGQLVLAYTEIDKKKAQKLATELFQIQEIYEGLDVDTVESSIWLSTKKLAPNLKTDNSPSILGTPLSDSLNVIKKKKKQHKHKGKLPKNYDSKIPPDPERWLPKYERSGYRKKRDRRAKEVIKGSQGTASGQADMFDFSKMTEPEDSPTTVDGFLTTKTQQKNKGQQKKKSKRR